MPSKGQYITLHNIIGCITIPTPSHALIHYLRFPDPGMHQRMRSYETTVGVLPCWCIMMSSCVLRLPREYLQFRDQVRQLGRQLVQPIHTSFEHPLQPPISSLHCALDALLHSSLQGL